MTGVLLRRGNTDTDTHMEGKVMGDRGGDWSQGMPEARGDLEYMVPHVPQKEQPCQHFDLRLLSSRAVRVSAI